MLPVQCKMARVAVGWGVRDLARNASVSSDTVSRLERGEDLKPATVQAIRTALEAAGVEFTSSAAPGVRLRPKRDQAPGFQGPEPGDELPEALDPAVKG